MPTVAGVLHLDVARQRTYVGLHAFHRSDQPVDQVHVVARLVHERTAVEFPGAAPVGAVVVGLGARPEHVDGGHVNAAEAALVARLLEQLQRGITPVLLHHQQVHAGIITGAHHAQAVAPARGHGFLGHHVATGRRGHDGLRGMQPARRAQRHHVHIRFGQQLGHGAEAHNAATCPPRGVERRRVRVAHRDQLQIVLVRLDGLEVIRRDATASDDADANGATHDLLGGFLHVVSSRLIAFCGCISGCCRISSSTSGLRKALRFTTTLPLTRSRTARSDSLPL